MHLTALASVEWFYVCMRLQVSAFDTSRIIPFVQPSDLNFSAPPGSASVCIDQTFQLPKKKEKKKAERSGIKAEMICCLSRCRRMGEKKGAHTQ